MFSILIDTCVWLDLAKDHQRQPIVTALEELIRQNQLELIVPRIVVDEFQRNKARIIEESGRSLSGTLKRVKEAVEKFGDPRKRGQVLRELNDVDHRIPTMGGLAAQTVARIDAMFAKARIIETSESLKARAAQRALDNSAPFHRQRNGIGDAIIAETYIDALAAKTPGQRFAFVTHNTKDFSHPTANTKLPHPDLASLFSRLTSRYFITLGEALRRVDPEQFADLMIEEEWIEEPRRLTEIGDAIALLFDQVWYNRHQVYKEKIERGITKLVDKESFPIKNHFRRPMQRDVWEGAQKAAAKLEKKRGLENLGPWTDFEWG